MNIIAIDVASEVSSYCILKSNGRIHSEDRVITRISHLKAVIKSVARPRLVVFEEGSQAAWLWSELHGMCDDLIVCDPRANKLKLGQFKSDKNDARKLAQLARGDQLTRVWHGGKELQSLREAVRTYQALTEHSTSLKNQIRSVFRGRGIAVGSKAYNKETRAQVIPALPLPVQHDRVNRIGAILDLVTIEREKSFKTMVKHARQQSRYKALRAIDGIGPVFTAMFLAEVGDPFRFRTKQQLWAYAGLAVTTHESSEYAVSHGKIRRKTRSLKTRGLVRSYNHNLKYISKQAAMLLSRSVWKEQYQQLLKNSKNPSNAQLTLARKLLCVMLHIAKTGEKYEVNKVFKTN